MCKYCSFCGKSQHEVQRLISGPKVFICNECVAVCNKLLATHEQDTMPHIEPEPSEADLIAEANRYAVEQGADPDELVY